MRRKDTKVAQLIRTGAAKDELVRSVRTGRISDVDEAGVVTVWIHGETRPSQARLAVAAPLAQIRHAIEAGQTVLLLVEPADPEHPIIIGFVEDRVAPEPQSPPIIEADVDGKRVRIQAQDEVVFECGKASITLRRNGRVIIKGTYVETHSDGTNRIKGGQVRIN